MINLECADLSALWFAARSARRFSYPILKQSGNKLPHSKGFAKTLNRYDCGSPIHLESARKRLAMPLFLSVLVGSSRRLLSRRRASRIASYFFSSPAGPCFSPWGPLRSLLQPSPRIHSGKLSRMMRPISSRSLKLLPKSILNGPHS